MEGTGRRGQVGRDRFERVGWKGQVEGTGWKGAGQKQTGLLPYLLLLEVQELHGAHLSVGLGSSSSVSAAAPGASPAAAATIGLVAEAAHPVLRRRRRADRLRGRFNHHDSLAGPEERGEECENGG